MTVGELIAVLQEFPDSVGVCVKVTESQAGEVADSGEAEFFDICDAKTEYIVGNLVTLSLV